MSGDESLGGAGDPVANKKSKLWNGFNAAGSVCGVLALFATVGWQFPSDLWKAYFSIDVERRDGIKNAINGMSGVYKELALSQSENITENSRFLLNSVLSVQIGYYLDGIKNYPDKAFINSSYFENVALAGMAYLTQRHDEALRFNKAAVFAAERENINPVEAYFGQANAVLGRDGSAGMIAARASYKLALKEARKRQRTGRADYAFAPLSVLMEVSIAELRMGSWECGNTIGSVVELQLTKPNVKNSPAVQATLATFRRVRSSITPTEVQAPFECDYLLSLM